MVKGYEIEEKEGIAGYPSPEKKGIKGYDFGPPTGAMKPTPLRDWEFTLATGEWLGPKRDLTGGAFFETIYDPVATRPLSANIYAGVRTIAEILPYARYIFPSGRDEWARKSTTGQTVELGIEALTILPIGLIGKGLKVTAKVVTKVGAFPFKATKKFALKKRTGALLEQDPFLDFAATSVKKYERLSAAERAMKKYEISGDEATGLLKRKSWIWEKSERSRAFYQSRGSTNFKKLFKKDGYLKGDVAKQLGRWARPQAEQELKHYNAEWMKLVKKTFGVKYDVENIFKMQAVKLFGEEVGKTLKLGDVDTNTFGLLIRDLLEENPAKLLKRMDIGYGHVMPYHTVPARKVFGLGERVWGAYSRIYEPVKDIFTSANKYGTLMTSKFHSLLASRGLGRLTAPKEAGVVMLKKNFSKREWEQAGELVTSLDNAVGKGVEQVELQAIMDQASTVVQKIAKSWFDFTDDLYGDYMKKKIPQIFEEMQLTARGRDGLSLLMKGKKGIDNIVDATLSQSANLAYADKAKILGAMLEKARNSLRGNLDWFVDKPLNILTKAEGEVLKSRLLRGMEELVPMKKGATEGFVNYLDKYATRIYEKQFAQSTKRSADLAKSRKAMFTKGRTREFAEEGQITDLTRIAEARINMQAKELYVYKPLEEVIDHARKLPEKFRNYSEHYIARQLGEASNADLALAQWLTGTVGRLTRTVYDERSVANLAHTINDLVYMGGLGFKPFSAMRNYFQPFLMVPADLGGVKDMYWLGKGYSAAFKKPTRDYIKSIGAIQEFAPDLYLRPRVIGFGGSFTVGGKKFDLPSTQTMRDLALWMFKNSDRHNRYVTGGAAIVKWDHFASKYLGKNLGKKEMKQFTKKVNVNSRDEWIRAKINEHLRSGTLEGLEEAKKIWVYDVIADTQWLYGTLDAPIYGQSAGSLGKMAGIFQSWWMNYGTALEKWALRTPGTAPVVNKRMMTWLLAGAIVEETASKLWQQKTAAKMVHVGPFPLRVSEFMIPPTFAPIYYAAKVLADGIDAVKYQEPERFKRSVKALARSGLMFIPGGLQMGQFYRGAKKEGVPGFLKAIVRYDPEREEEY